MPHAPDHSLTSSEPLRGLPKRIFWMVPLLLMMGQQQNAGAEGLTGQYLATGNISTISEPWRSLNSRFGFNYAPSSIAGSFDGRVEFYTEPSFHSIDHRIVNEHKFETQLNYTYSPVEHVALIAGVLYHENHTFQDAYYWALAGVSVSGDVARATPVTFTALAEKRDGSGIIFYDFAGSIEHKFRTQYGIFVSAHIYENMGESDREPTDKQDFRISSTARLAIRMIALTSSS